MSVESERRSGSRRRVLALAATAALLAAALGSSAAGVLTAESPGLPLLLAVAFSGAALAALLGSWRALTEPGGRTGGEAERLAAAAELREDLFRCTRMYDFARRALKGVSTLLDLEDAQLTLYYDQPFALEVTHIRLLRGQLSHSVERMREDEPPSMEADEQMLTPVTATHTEMLSRRDRLVGLLLIGHRRGGADPEPDPALLRELAEVVGAAAEQVMMLRKLQETSQRLFESEKLMSIGQLASGIAHEIRNPLTSIKLNLQGLQKSGALDDRNARRLQISLAEIDRLDASISELMSFARRTRLEVAPVDGARLAGTAADVVREDVERRGIRLLVSGAEELPVVQADEARIVQALINLILNGAQAMSDAGRDEGRTIEVRVESYGAGLEITVRDEGPGIPETLRRDIFNPFFTTKAEGTGLGLANALKFVQEHGGELDFTTEEGVGTTFSLRLPPEPPEHLEDPSALRVLPR